MQKLKANGIMDLYIYWPDAKASPGPLALP